MTFDEEVRWRIVWGECEAHRRMRDAAFGEIRELGIAIPPDPHEAVLAAINAASCEDDEE